MKCKKSRIPVSTRYCGDIGFLLDLHRSIDQLRIEVEVNYIFFQHHNDVVAITQHNEKLHVIVIPIFNVVLISGEDENAINNAKHFVLFYFRSSRPEASCKKGGLRNFAKFIGKQPEPFLRLGHRCLPVNFAKFRRTIILYGNIVHKMQI